LQFLVETGIMVLVAMTLALLLTGPVIAALHGDLLSGSAGLGAGVPELVSLLSREFILLVGFSIVIAHGQFSGYPRRRRESCKQLADGVI
jgi:hypothetical protein